MREQIHRGPPEGTPEGTPGGTRSPGCVMWGVVTQVALAVAAAGITAVAVVETRRIDREGGVLLRREKRRCILTAVYAVGMLLWPVVLFNLPYPESKRGAAAALLPLMWPLVLIGVDLLVTRYHVQNQSESENQSHETRSGSQWIIGAVFATGMLLAVIKQRQSGHGPPSAKVLLLCMLGMLAFVLPIPSSRAESTLTWTTRAVQRVVLHASIGLFLLATVLAWDGGSTCAPAAGTAVSPSKAVVGFVGGLVNQSPSQE